MKRRRIIAALVAGSATACLASCATFSGRAGDAVVTELRLSLSPASLGREIAQWQRISLVVGGRTVHVEAWLEADARSLRLAVLSLGQVVGRIAWDGIDLVAQLPPGLPAQFDARQVLTELQLIHWPASALAAALPAGWSMRDDGHARVFSQRAVDAVAVRFLDGGIAELVHLRGAPYRLRVEAAPGDTTP